MTDAPAAAGAPEQPRADAPPAPIFTVLGARAVEHGAAPVLSFTLGVEEPAGREVYAIALRTQIQLEPARRRYAPPERELLVELFGAPERWGATTRSFLWHIADTMVPQFIASATFDIPMACTYDLELAAVKYLYSLEAGDAPLSLHFSGTVFYPAAEGRLQLVQIPWSTTTSFDLPVKTWKDMMAEHYPDRGWVAVRGDTLERLYRHKARLGTRNFDECVSQLLDAAQA